MYLEETLSNIQDVTFHHKTSILQATSIQSYLWGQFSSPHLVEFYEASQVDLIRLTNEASQVDHQLERRTHLNTVLLTK